MRRDEGCNLGQIHQWTQGPTSDKHNFANPAFYSGNPALFSWLLNWLITWSKNHLHMLFLRIKKRWWNNAYSERFLLPHWLVSSYPDCLHCFEALTVPTAPLGSSRAPLTTATPAMETSLSKEWPFLSTSVWSLCVALLHSVVGRWRQEPWKQPSCIFCFSFSIMASSFAHLSYRSFHLGVLHPAHDLWPYRTLH